MGVEGGTTSNSRKQGLRWVEATLWLLLLTGVGYGYTHFAPTLFGGPASYALIDGRSMQPLLEAGDLAFFLRAAEYQVGDLVLVETHGGRVAHRIVDGDAEHGWRTQGDNAPHLDPWVTWPGEVLGKYVSHSARAGAVVGWVDQHLVQTGIYFLAFVALLFAPVPQRKSPFLKYHLRYATESQAHRRGWLRGLVVFLTACTGATALFAVAVLSQQNEHRQQAAIVMAVGAAFGIAALGVVIYALRGSWLPEPTRSLYVLGTHLMELQPGIEPPTILRELATLNRFAKLVERASLPVLHRVADGRHEFYLITRRHTYFWSPPVGTGVSPKFEPPKS